MEVGPYRVTPEGNLEYNVGSWDEFANVLFVDNPVGTGFSYVDTNSYLHELNEMAANFVVFLEKWFAIFPEYEHDDVSSAHTPCCVFSNESRSTLLVSRTLVSTSRISPKRSWTTTTMHPSDLGI